MSLTSDAYSEDLRLIHFALIDIEKLLKEIRDMLKEAKKEPPK